MLLSTRWWRHASAYQNISTGSSSAILYPTVSEACVLWAGEGRMTETEHQASLFGDIGESGPSSIPTKGKTGRRTTLSPDTRALAMIPDEKSPLAARMRPRTLDEIVGQDHLLAPGRALRKAIEGDSVPSMILWGP